jgi:hypothetical protein
MKHARNIQMRASYKLLSIALCSMQQLAIAQSWQHEAVTTLTSELKANIPPQWLVHVRWRDGKLLASITPLPYDEAFKLFYEPSRLSETMRGLCPNSKERIWTLISPDQDVILEPTVGGKSGADLQVSCRQWLRNGSSASTYR